MIGALNKVYGKTWNLDNVTYSDGVFTFTPNVLAMATCSMPKPVPNHVYYGSVMQKAPAGSSFPDRRFEWWKSDTVGELMVFAYMDDTNGEWVRQSSVFQASSETSDSWIMRNFTANGTAESYRKSPIIIDLTAVFGAGNEPTAEWVDENMILSENEDCIYFDIPSNVISVDGNRRMALLCGIEKKIYIYKSGFTKWKNIKSATADNSITTAFGADSVAVTAGTTSSTTKLDLLISEKTYSKYNSLVFTAKCIGGSLYSKITWTNVSSGSVVQKTLYSSNVDTVTFDISENTGDYYFSIVPYKEGGTIYIYDIHFE